MTLQLLSIMAMQAAHVDAVQIWPVSVAGWATLVLAVIGLAGALYSYAKTMVHLNGLGERVTAVENRQERSEEREQQILRSIDKVTAAQDGLLKELGRAQAGAVTCSEEMEKYAIDVGAKVDELAKSVAREARAAGERLQALETELSLTRRRYRGEEA